MDAGLRLAKIVFGMHRSAVAFHRRLGTHHVDDVVVLLTEGGKQRKKDGKYVGQDIDEPPKFDIK